MVKDFGHVFRCFLATCVSSLTDCLLSSFVGWVVGLIFWVSLVYFRLQLLLLCRVGIGFLPFCRPPSPFRSFSLLVEALYFCAVSFSVPESPSCVVRVPCGTFLPIPVFYVCFLQQFSHLTVRPCSPFGSNICVR